MGVSAAVAAVGFVSSQQQQKKAQRARAQSEEASQKRADLKAQRERVKQVRQARIQRGKIAAASSGGAGTGGSGAIGASASVLSQTASNISFLDQQQAISKDISGFNIAAGQADSRAATGAAVSNLAVSFKGLNGKSKTPNSDLFESVEP